jgi:hypothetical protein
LSSFIQGSFQFCLVACVENFIKVGEVVWICILYCLLVSFWTYGGGFKGGKHLPIVAGFFLSTVPLGVVIIFGIISLALHKLMNERAGKIGAISAELSIKSNEKIIEIFNIKPSEHGKKD